MSEKETPKESRVEAIAKKGNDALDDFYDRNGEWDGTIVKGKRVKHRDHS
jgi:hypothetical protein